MLTSHFTNVENYLASQSRIPSISGHSLHKGTPREQFVESFLSSHISTALSIGTGEIIDANSTPGEQRNQIDIVLYRKEYPRIAFSQTIFGFLVESVIATIEVKSILTKDDLRTSVRAARRLKGLSTSNPSAVWSGYIPPKMLNFVFAYTGPASIDTVHRWLDEIHKEEAIELPIMPADINDRLQTPSPSIDAIFVLDNGIVHFDNMPLTMDVSSLRSQNNNVHWIIIDHPPSTLLFMFAFLTQATINFTARSFDMRPYLQRLNIAASQLRGAV